eukprot:TRINITY_DN9146_c0_g1_i1.p2 TRINITY_DN9146_c0_g1~~TRINITY_DN9146_c0_g1_i1.p2  ORF type:complete len:111 (-),score=5.95 TRINITY_DN9146_c0_g1_i1:521-853(-)
MASSTRGVVHVCTRNKPSSAHAPAPTALPSSPYLKIHFNAKQGIRHGRQRAVSTSTLTLTANLTLHLTHASASNCPTIVNIVITRADGPCALCNQRQDRTIEVAAGQSAA